MLSTPRELLEQMAPALQSVLGFQQCGGLGHVDNQHPSALLRREASRVALAAYQKEQDSRHAAHRAELARSAFRAARDLGSPFGRL